MGKMYDDPRDEREETEMTASSGDELADLEKEYEARRRALLQKRDRDRTKRECGRHSESECGQHRESERRTAPHKVCASTREREDGEKKESAERGQGASGPRRSVEVNRSRSPSPSPAQRARREGPIGRAGRSAEGAPTAAAPKAAAPKSAGASAFAAGAFAAALGSAVAAPPAPKQFSFPPLPRTPSPPCVDPLTHLHLRKLYHTPQQLADACRNLKVLTVDKFLAKVAPPGFEEPQYPNWVLAAVVLRKLEPQIDKRRAKYLRLALGDLNDMSVDLMLFGDSFKKYWKVQVGDVVAVLNPVIRKYRLLLGAGGAGGGVGGGSGPRGFNLVLDDALDALVEVGAARDFGYCQLMTRSGERCRAVVNTKRAEHCNFHQLLAVRRAGSKRMELNGSVAMKSPTKRDGTRQAVYVGARGGSIVADFAQFRAAPPAHVSLGLSFFRDEYTSPKMLANLQEKRRKVRDARADERLQQRLGQIKLQASLRQLGLERDRTHDEARRATDVEKVAFSLELVSQIGFNPAAAHAETSPTKRGLLLQGVQELYKLSGGQKSLAALAHDAEEKRRRWGQTMRAHAPSAAKKNTPLQLLVPPARPAFSADSDSDIEIEFGSDSEKRRYLLATGTTAPR